MLHILVILAFISVGDFIGARFLPNSLTFLHSFHEDTGIGVAI